MVVFDTPIMEGDGNMDYKGYNIAPMRTFSMFEIKAKGQGKVPAPLSGKYTDATSARQAVDQYLSSLLKGKTNGKTKVSGTG